MLDNINIYIVIVVYKKQLFQCKAYTSINNINLKHKNLKLIIWNNSPDIKIGQKDFDYFEGSNTSLSKIYNTISSKYLQLEGDFLMLSDDDTDYSNYDFEKLFETLKYASLDTGVFIPQLYANSKLVSPGKRILFKGKYIDAIDSGLVSSKNILAMNSGTIITYKCFKEMPFLFDERLNFYGTDTDFFIRYEKYFKYLYVLPFKIVHDLSENNYDAERAKFRTKDNLYALNIIFTNRTFIEKILFKIYAYYLKVKG